MHGTYIHTNKKMKKKIIVNHIEIVCNCWLKLYEPKYLVTRPPMAKPLACDMESSPARGYTNFVILRKSSLLTSAASHLCPIIHAYEVNIYFINVSLVLLPHNLRMPGRVVSERGVE